MRPGQHKRLSNWTIGLILIVILAVGSVLAYNKKLPWSKGYRVEAVFVTAQNVRVKSPVRIAGVNIGEVVSVEHLTSDDPDYQAAAGEPTASGEEPPGQAAAVVTMEIKDEGRPIREDSTFKLRPRLFLEGNLFVELSPGSPSSPEVPDGYRFPPSQTSNSVQLDQVLTTLQSDVRTDLQVFLHEFGDALIKYGGAEGFREFFRTSPGANKWTARVNEAFLGTEPHDLSGLIENLDSTVAALDRNETELQNLVTNLRNVTGSFAAEGEALGDAVRRLPRVLEIGTPALENLDASLPALSTFARQALPGTKTAPAAIDAATPFLGQVRKLVSEDELRGLVHDLKPAIPELVKLSRVTVPFLDQSRALSSCFNEVIIPWSNDTVPDTFFPATGRVFEETGYSLTGLGGESRSGDANGQYIRVGAGGGTNTLLPLNTGFLVESNPASSAVPFFGFVAQALIGAQPAIESSAKTPFRPDVPCEEQEPPDLDSGEIATPPNQIPVSGLGALAAPLQQLSDQAKGYLTALGKASTLGEQGKRSRSLDLLKRLGDWDSFRDGVVGSLIDQLKGLGSRSLGGDG